jgi:hypothetical protein
VGGSGKWHPQWSRYRREEGGGGDYSQLKRGGGVIEGARPLGSLHGVEGGRHSGQGAMASNGGGARSVWAKEEEEARWAEWAERPKMLTRPETKKILLLK